MNSFITGSSLQKKRGFESIGRQDGFFEALEENAAGLTAVSEVLHGQNSYIRLVYRRVAGGL